MEARAEPAVACRGRVKFFVPEKGWGRLEVTEGAPEDFPVGDGVFVHYKDIVISDEKTLASLDEGQEVSFKLFKGEKGWQANEVTALDGNPVKSRLHRTMLAGIFRGVVSHWNTPKAFGWISTDLSFQSLGMQRVPKSVLTLNDGRVYFRWRDCGASREASEAFVQRGKAVVFQLYWDEKGLGAMHVCDAITLQPLASAAGGGVDGYKQLQAVQELPATEQLQELSKEMTKCLACLMVTRAQAGSIIGPKGETVRGFKERAGVDSIFVDKDSLDHRLVELKGTPTAIAGAALLIAEHLAAQPEGQAAPGSPEVCWFVPDDGFGRVVGKGKAQLAAIEERYRGAKLQIEARTPVATGLAQCITVSGEREAMAEAAKMLLARIVTCSTVMPLPRTRTVEMMPSMPFKPGVGGFNQNLSPSNPMHVLQHLGMQQFSGKPYLTGAKGGTGNTSVGGKGGSFKGGAVKGGFKGSPGGVAPASPLQGLKL